MVLANQAINHLMIYRRPHAIHGSWVAEHWYIYIWLLNYPNFTLIRMMKNWLVCIKLVFIKQVLPHISIKSFFIIRSTSMSIMKYSTMLSRSTDTGIRGVTATSMEINMMLEKTENRNPILIRLDQILN